MRHRSPCIPALHRLPYAVATLICALAASACSPAPATAPDDPPPQPEAGALRETIQAPLEAAGNTQQVLDDAARQQREAIEAAGG